MDLDRILRKYFLTDKARLAAAEQKIAKALAALDEYSARHAYGDAVLFAKAALLGISVDALIESSGRL